MRSPLLSLALLAVTAGSVLAMGPAVADVTAPVDGTPADACTDTVGRELLTADGLDLAVASPAVTAPELAATADVTGEAITPHRSAHWFFTVDGAPYAEVNVTATITWDDADSTPSDYDLNAFTYTQGYRHGFATSNESNIDGGDTRSESFTAKISDCGLIDLEMRSWAGNPAQNVSLSIEIEPVGDPLEDVAPRPADARLGLYLAGDRPGNLGTPQDTAGAEYPFSGRFSEDRPTANVPNATTRPVAGSTIEKNPVQPWWAGQLDTFPTVQGTPSAIVWLSSPTQQQDPGEVLVQLFLNGSEHTVVIPGEQLTADVQPFLIEFPEVDAQVYQYSLQVSALPVASPNAASEHLGDANHTVWFDSVQYQSTLFLPTVAG